MTDGFTDTEVRRDRFGRALIVPNGGVAQVAHTRMTTIAETLDDRWALERWGKRQVAVGLAQRADLLHLVKAHKPTDRKILDEVCDKAMEAAKASAAASTGTALHRVLERVNRGELQVDDVDEEFRERVEATLVALDRAGVVVKPDLVERHCVLAAHTASGTSDFYGADADELVICDYKTGSTVAFGSTAFAVQLAGYAHAETFYDFATQAHAPTPDVRQDLALIVHVPAAGGPVEIHELDIAKGWDAFERAMWVRTWRKAKLLTPRAAQQALPGVRPNALPIRPVNAPNPTVSWERPDEGSAVDLARTKAQIVEAIGGDPTVEADLKRWVAEGHRAGRGWRITEHPTQRVRLLYRCAVRLSRWAPDDADARVVLGIALGDEVQPAVTVGQALGSLTIVEAELLLDILERLLAGAAMTFDDAGRAHVA